MKIAVIIDTWFPAVGGGQINALEISKNLAKKGVMIDIVTRNNGNYEKDEIKNLQVYRLGPKSKPIDNVSRIFFLFNAFFFIKKRDYDIVHLQAFLPGLLSPVIKLFLGRPTVFTVHGTRMFEENPNKTFSFLLEKFILTKIKYDAQISVTKAFIKFKNINKKIIYISNGVDIQKFKKNKTQKTKYLKILWVGRFDPIKNVENLIKAMSAINIKIPDSKLTLVGYGNEEKKMKDLVNKLSIKNIQFVGKKEGNDLITEYKSSHMFVLPSLSEGQPLTLLEAWASKLPVIACKTGDCGYLVKNAFNGFLLTGTTDKEIAKVVVKASHYNLLKIGENGYNFVNGYFSWAKSASKTYKIYKKIAKKNS